MAGHSNSPCGGKESEAVAFHIMEHHENGERGSELGRALHPRAIPYWPASLNHDLPRKACKIALPVKEQEPTNTSLWRTFQIPIIAHMPYNARPCVIPDSVLLWASCLCFDIPGNASLPKIHQLCCA